MARTTSTPPAPPAELAPTVEEALAGIQAAFVAEVAALDAEKRELAPDRVAERRQDIERRWREARESATPGAAFSDLVVEGAELDRQEAHLATIEARRRQAVIDRDAAATPMVRAEMDNLQAELIGVLARAAAEADEVNDRIRALQGLAWAHGVTRCSVSFAGSHIASDLTLARPLLEKQLAGVSPWPSDPGSLSKGVASPAAPLTVLHGLPS